MKTTIMFLFGTAIFLMLFPVNVIAQDDSAEEEEFKPMIITMARAHWNMDNENFKMDEWKEIEKQWNENVVKKNDYIVGSAVFLHLYTPDNSEILFATAYASWEDVDKAAKRNSELAAEAWPDKAERDAFFKKQSAYYSNIHSDEIYSTTPNGKRVTGESTEPNVVYFRTSRMSWPDDGESEEIQAMHKELSENTHHKSENIIGYYPMRHLYGADSREFLEVFVAKSMADIDAYNSEEYQKLVEAHWPDEAKRKEFFDSMGNYFDGWHGDLLYSSVPELGK